MTDSRRSDLHDDGLIVVTIGESLDQPYGAWAEIEMVGPFASEADAEAYITSCDTWVRDGGGTWHARGNPDFDAEVGRLKLRHPDDERWAP